MFTFAAKQPLFPEIIALHGRWRHRDALIVEDSRCSWPEFARQARAFGNGLNRNGISRGDRVAVVMDNSLETAIGLFGIMSAGAVSVPINLSVSDETLAAMIGDSGARAVIATEGQRSRLEPIKASRPFDSLLYIAAGAQSGNWLSFGGLVESGRSGAGLPELSGDDYMNVIYSSGTTGRPKGIVHTHRGRLDWAYDLAVALRYHGSSRTLVNIGMYSNISWVAMLCTVLAGGTLVIEPRFDAGATLDAIERHGITNLAMVPIQYQRIVEEQQARPRDLSSLTAAMSCGSPLHEELKRTLFAILPCGVIELYGLTEGIITTLEPEDAPGRWSSVGKPLAGTDLRIVGTDDREAAVGETGEIVFRGRITMPGYLNREEATFESRWTDKGGRDWLRSGDIGRLDEEGFLYVVDRKKDMILSGGQNIYPQDIEAVLSRHPAVDDVAVIPARSERWGETPVALVVSNDGGPQEQDLKSWCNERVGRQQRIADVLFVDDLPRNANGKVLKRRLRSRYRDLHYA